MTRPDLKRPGFRGAALFAGATCAAVLCCYAFCLRLPFFLDDLPIISWLSGHETRDIWLGQEGGYYRPLPYFVYTLGLLLPGNAAQIFLHGVSLMLLWSAAFMLAQIVFVLGKDRTVALMAGIMLPFYPFLSQAIPWVTAMVHPMVLTLCLGAAWSALIAPTASRPIVYWSLSTLAIGLSPLVHESGIVSGLLVVTLLVVHYGFRWHLVVAPSIGILLNVLMLIARSFLPYAASATDLRGLQDLVPNSMFFVQGLFYPLGPLVRIATDELGWHDLTTYAALGVTLLPVTWAISRNRPHRKLISAGLLWWAISAMPAGLSMRYADLYIAPRLYTLSAAGSILFWLGCMSSLAALFRPPVKSLALAAMVLLVLGPSAHYLDRQRALYLALDAVYDDVLQVCRALPDSRRMGIVNLPAGLFREDRTFPLVTEDVLFVPPYSSVAEFAAVNRTRCAPTSIVVGSIAQKTNPTWMSQGPSLSAPEFRVFASEQDLVVVTRYAPDTGRFSLAKAGKLRATRDVSCPRYLARFEPGPLICAAELAQEKDGTWLVTLDWLAREPVAATVFVHLLDARGSIVSQADGPALGGALPLEAWQPGDRIADVRTLSIPSGAHAPFRVLVGLYSGTERYPVWPRTGAQPLDAVVVGEIVP